MIWLYEDFSPCGLIDVRRRVCVFCRTPLRTLFKKRSRKTHSYCVRVCDSCGWWWFHDAYVDDKLSLVWRRSVHPQLKQLDLSDLSVPIQDVERYLSARYESRFEVHPRRFEEVVASVFKDHGYAVSVTAYHCDGGVDVLLTRGSDTIGVQVKRYRNTIGVEQIRSLAGALIVGGITKGMFVTTSRFSRGAEKCARRLRRRGMPIKLLDAERFFDALRLARKPAYQTLDNWLIGPGQSAISSLTWQRQIPCRNRALIPSAVGQTRSVSSVSGLTSRSS